MADLNGTPAWKAKLRALETTDPKHPSTWNPNYQDLINNDAYLKLRADIVDAAAAGHASLTARLAAIEAMQVNLQPEQIADIHALAAAALAAASQSGDGVLAMRTRFQQEGEVVIRNRGVVTGVTVAKSTTAARNLNLTGGICFANGREYSVASADNAASVPANISGSVSATVYAYLYWSGATGWRLAVTAIGQAVPDDAITLYSLTIPPNSTDATDPTLSSVTLTSQRRVEQHWPRAVDAPATAMIALNPYPDNQFRVDIDVVSATGAPCPSEAVVISSRASNGLSLQLLANADSVRLRYRTSRLALTNR